MKFGFSLIMRGNDATPDSFAKLAERAEALKVDSLWCSDHLIIPKNTVHGYLGRADGQVPPHWRERYWEPFTVLAYLAALTETVTLGTSVCILPMRNPIETASMVADLDQLSGGRIVFGVGVGWFEEEFNALGWPFHERGARTNEGLALAKTLWTEELPSFEGKFYQFGESYFAPKPVQKPHPPIWIAGAASAALRRVAKYGDGWHPFKLPFDKFAELKLRLAGFMEDEGRKLEDLTISMKGHLVIQDQAPAPDAWQLEGRQQDIVEAIRRYGEMGVEHFTLDFLPETLAQALDTMERFCQEIRPQVQ